MSQATIDQLKKINDKMLDNSKKKQLPMGVKITLCIFNVIGVLSVLSIIAMASGQ